MPISINAPSQNLLLILQMLCLLVWPPLTLQDGALFGVEHQFDEGRGSFLVWLFFILWVHRYFERWLTIIGQPSPWTPMMIHI
jgi:hypothetical protein